MSQMRRIKTLNVRGPSNLGSTGSISWLLMPWLLTSPRHQQPWYWLYGICTPFSYLRKEFKYLCQINVEEWHRMQIYVYVPSEKFSTLKYTGETLLYTGLYIYFSTQSTEEDLELIPPSPPPVVSENIWLIFYWWNRTCFGIMVSVVRVILSITCCMQAFCVNCAFRQNHIKGERMILSLELF